MNEYTKASLVADSLSLGAHWVYEQEEIGMRFPNGIYEFSDPISGYHGKKRAGDLTHYGDQTTWLADLVSSEQYSIESWRKIWVERMSTYEGYVDGASKATLTSGGIASSSSNDLAGASRIAPLLDLPLNLQSTIEAARSQTELTHGDPAVSDSAEFFVRAIFAFRNSRDISASLKRAAEEGTYSSDLPSLIRMAEEADSKDFLTVGNDLGLTCHFPDAFPLTLYFLLHHGGRFVECMSRNALAGGDTSARGMLISLFFAEEESALIRELAGGLNG